MISGLSDRILVYRLEAPLVTIATNIQRSSCVVASLSLYRKRSDMKKLVLLLLTTILAGCALLQAPLTEPNVSLADLRLLDASLFEQRYAIKIRVQNPNAVDLPVAGTSLQLEINDALLGRGVSNQAVTVPAYGEAVMQINVVSNLTRVLDQIRAFESGAATRLRYRLFGDIRIANRFGTLPFDYRGEIGLPP